MLLLSNRIRCAGLLAVVGLLASSSFASNQHGAAKVKQLSVPSAQKKLDQNSARFIQNVGQWPNKALFLARSQRINTWITKRGVTFDYYRPTSSEKDLAKLPKWKGQVVSMSFKGAKSFAPVGINKMQFENLYFRGQNQAEHKAGNYAGVYAKDVYPGVDFRSYYDQAKTRYDLIVKPNADPSAIHLLFHGADKTAIKANTIQLSTHVGPLSQGKLYAYQNVNGKKVQVKANFVTYGNDEFGLSLGAYDRSKNLVIDPLVYGTYYGGDASFDSVNSVVTDNAGGVYLTGYTMSYDFPVIDGPYGFTIHGGKDAFVAKLQGDAYDQDYCAYVGGSLDDNAQYVKVDPFGDIWIAGRTYSSDFPGYTGNNIQYLQTDNFATGGYFVLQYGGAQSTAHIPYNATAATVQTALNKILSGVVVTSINPAGDAFGPLVSEGAVYEIVLPGSDPLMLSVPPDPLTGASTVVGADYSIFKTSSIFVMRFQQDPNTVLNPNPGNESVQFFGGQSVVSEMLAGFAIQPEANPLSTDPVNFVFGGSIYEPTPEIPNFQGIPLNPNGYVIKYSFSRNTNTFTEDSLITRYVTGGDGLDLTGVAMDLQGSVYTGGTLYYGGNADTSQGSGASVFTTTPGVFTNGRLVRFDDLFVQKYTTLGGLAYSAVIGGSDNDIAGGFDFDEDWTLYNSGNTIDIDTNLDLYIVGIAGSFNFPRTRGVYGEVFTRAANVSVTKINTDASQILYSTNLKTGGFVMPSGVAVDIPGDAFITGNVHPDWYQFPDSITGSKANAGNPNEPSSMPLGTIQTTSDALVPTNLQPTGPAGDMATVKGFLNILDPAADKLTYGTYLGGALDDRCFGPYVDAFGDVWVFGWVDVARLYVLYNSSNPPAPTVFSDGGSYTDGWLPAAMISPLAFKSVPFGSVTDTIPDVWYGYLSTYYFPGNNGPYVPWSFPPTTGTPPNPGYSVGTIPVSYGMEGWVDKLRVGLASISGMTLSPTTIPGGFGASTTGTVTLSQAAPNGGATVILTLLNNTTAATFTNGVQQSTMPLPIPAGATTATFTVYSNAVTANTPVQVQAGYEGSFQIGLFTVTPWLQQLSLTPTSIVGGNSVTGKITLAALPPTGSGGVPVNVFTDTPTVVSFSSGTLPGSTIVTVPEGQTSVDFTINTKGVTVTSFPNITASYLGVGLTQTLQVNLASLYQLTFQPASVSGGTAAIATLTLNGQATTIDSAGDKYTVNLTPSDPAFTFEDLNNNPITSITFNPGDTQEQFQVITPYEPDSTSVVVTAAAPAQGNYTASSVSGTLFVSSQNLSQFSISPTEVAGGGSSTGTVTINNAAPNGGVTVFLSSSNASVATVPTSVLIPAGATTATFTISTIVTGSSQSVTITATRGPVSIQQVLTIDGVAFGLSIRPTSLVGGPTGIATGTITLASSAPAGGLNFTLTSDHPNDAYFGASPGSSGTATIAGGSLTGTFLIYTATETSTVEAGITANITGGTASQAQTANLEIRQVGVASITFSPSKIRGMFGISICTITLDAPAPTNNTGGALVTLTQTTPLLNLNSGGYLVPSGATSVSFPVKAILVSRNLSTVVTATPPNGGGSAEALIVVTR